MVVRSSYTVCVPPQGLYSRPWLWSRPTLHTHYLFYNTTRTTGKRIIHKLFTSLWFIERHDTGEEGVDGIIRMASALQWEVKGPNLRWSCLFCTRALHSKTIFHRSIMCGLRVLRLKIPSMSLWGTKCTRTRFIPTITTHFEAPQMTWGTQIEMVAMVYCTHLSHNQGNSSSAATTWWVHFLWSAQGWAPSLLPQTRYTVWLWLGHDSKSNSTWLLSHGNILLCTCFGSAQFTRGERNEHRFRPGAG